MGNLSNLYISQSYISLIHLGSDNTASATLTELEDGLGNGIGISVNTVGDLQVDGILSASIITELSQSIVNIVALTGSYATTGSNTFVGNQTINGDVQVNGTLSANEIHTIIESSSIIYSSGSNILGDEIGDTQTLIGTVIVSGSQNVTGSVTITGTISSPTITGINDRLTNLESFTASTDSRLDNLESKSASVDISVSNLNSFSSSQLDKDATLETVTASLNTFTASANSRLDNLESISASLLVSVSNINTFTASNGNTSLNSYTGSNDTKWSTLSSYTSSNDQKWNNLELATSSFATTGSNTFNGSQTITGSVYGNVSQLSIVSNTASMDMSLGNLFSLNLSNSSTHLDATNVGLGQTVNLLITQDASGTGTLTLSPEFFQPAGFAYAATAVSGAQDVLTFVTFGSNAKIYTLNAKQFV